MVLESFTSAVSERVTRLNYAVARSKVGAYFKLDDGESPGRRQGSLFTVRIFLALSSYALF